MTAYELINLLLNYFGESIDSEHPFFKSNLETMKQVQVFVTNPEGPIEGAVIPLEKPPVPQRIYAWPDHSDNLEAYTTEWPSNFTDCPREEWVGLVIR